MVHVLSSDVMSKARISGKLSDTSRAIFLFCFVLFFFVGKERTSMYFVCLNIEKQPNEARRWKYLHIFYVFSLVFVSRPL